MKIAISELREKMLNTLTKNFSEDESNKIADVLIWCDMAGISTMGTMKMTGSEPVQDIKPKYDIKVDKETKLSALIDAGANPAPLAAQMATTIAINKASEHGFAIVGVHNTFSSTAAQAYYANKIAEKDLIGIVMSGSPAVFAPFDSIDPLFGTNPIGFAFPTLEDPILFDMTTSARAWYALIRAKNNGELLPNNVAIDREGNPTNDPQTAMDGAMLPFDEGYKGSGLGMMIELLTGPLVKAAYVDTALDAEYGTTIIAIDPELLVDIDDFKAANTDLIKRIKSSRKKPGVEEIRLPGERAQAAYKDAEKSGMVEVDEVVLKQLGYV